MTGLWWALICENRVTEDVVHLFSLWKDKHDKEKRVSFSLGCFILGCFLF